MRHVVWDWNGTLLDDRHVVVAGLNTVLAEVGIAPIGLDTYQQIYTRPVQVFYERLFGRAIAPEEWPRLDEVYHDGYHDALGQAGLAADALEALDLVAAAGATQSLLSMYQHDDLLPLVERYGIFPRFLLVEGLRGPGGGLKAPFLAQHLERVAAVDGHGPPGQRVVVIGDALDDAHAAAEVGVGCVLYDGGSHPREALDAVGVPVAASLVDAVRLAALTDPSERIG